MYTRAYTINLIMTGLKGLFIKKLKIYHNLTHSHVVPNLYEFLYSVSGPS